MRSHILNIWTVSVVFLGTLSSNAGGLVGNGGDAVKCLATAGSNFTGVMSLDYLLTYKSENKNGDIVSVNSLKESFERIARNIKAKVPELMPSFDEFIKTYRNTSNLTLARYWEESPFGLITLDDQKIISLVPTNCREDGKVRVVQAVIRQTFEFTGTKKGKIVYRFVPSVLDDLELNGPLQLSFLLIHEYLWDHSINVDRNRRVNRFMHSEAFDRMNRDEILHVFAELGLSIPKMQPPVFYDSSCTPDPEAAKSLVEKIPDRGSGAIIGRASPYIRTKSCFDNDNCGAQWVNDERGSSIYFGNHPHFFIQNKYHPSIQFRSLVVARPAAVHATCELNQEQATLKCTKLLSKEGGSIHFGSYIDVETKQDTVEFKGVVGQGCIRLKRVGSSTIREPQNRWKSLQEFVIFSDMKIRRDE